MFNDKQYCVVIASASALIAFVFIMRFLPDFVVWRGWELCRSDCSVIDWIGAVSGLLGTLIAAVAAYFLLRQLDAQQVQTAFAVGDALPTMDAIEHLNNSTQLVVRIVNWNRRAIVVRSVATGNSNVLLIPDKLSIDETRKALEPISFSVPSFAIKGWEDRAGKPSHAEIRFSAMEADGTELSFMDDWKKVASISAKLEILGGSHKIIELVADTRVLLS
ncbi:hypothetical protein G6L37_13475 [Agrobacterium rubi]|uniref:hypothetical protein n=1 Tax=Agrobacterium rubi TaxID=28099 RepID=UPI001573C0E2|nr:hypothetical protein [Agrobacterium rubi]NTF07158.1 hypothetical protein [Agrobacterium rubi]NTF19414.1 hypothetical protein [Agrobacterium rubi]NTF26377.1 hypothetical protein [Agrobacterium rubi]